MKFVKSVLSTIVLTGLTGLALTPGARADDWNLRTKVTFNQSVEIPHMVLGPGTYVMKVAEPRNGNLVQFYNENETHLYATVFAIPAYRLNITGKTQIVFEERAANQPQAIKEWFYPGNYWGEQFVYPKTQQVTMNASTASSAGQPPVKYFPAAQSAPSSSERQLAARPPEAAPAPQPAVATVPQQSEPAEMAQASPAPAIPAPEDRPASLPVTAAPAPNPARAPSELPKTASELGLIAVAGLFLAITGWLIRRQLA